MAGCGYVCPQCEGKELLEDGNSCPWCSQSEPTENDINGNESVVIKTSKNEPD